MKNRELSTSTNHTSTITQPIISAANLNHYFGQGELQKQVLFDINLNIKAGEIVIMTGHHRVLEKPLY